MMFVYFNYMLNLVFSAFATLQWCWGKATIVALLLLLARIVMKCHEDSEMQSVLGTGQRGIKPAWLCIQSRAGRFGLCLVLFD